LGSSEAHNVARPELTGKDRVVNGMREKQQTDGAKRVAVQMIR
jgi:hypothetical protein